MKINKKFNLNIDSNNNSNIQNNQKKEFLRNLNLNYKCNLIMGINLINK